MCDKEKNYILKTKSFQDHSWIQDLEPASKSSHLGKYFSKYSQNV